MIADAQTDRAYAYFKADGVFDPAALTGIIGIEPAECWAAGEEYTRRGHNLKRRNSCWKLDSGLNDSEPLDRHIEALLVRLKPLGPGLLKAASMARLQIVCVGFCHGNFSWELTFEHQRLATALGICFWFDIYGFGDVHEEMVALREQLGMRADISEA